MAGREEGAAVEVLHILFQAAQEDGVFAPLHGPGQDFGVGKEVGVQQLQQKSEVLRISLVGGGGQQEQVFGVIS